MTLMSYLWLRRQRCWYLLNLTLSLLIFHKVYIMMHIMWIHIVYCTFRSSPTLDFRAISCSQVVLLTDDVVTFNLQCMTWYLCECVCWNIISNFSMKGQKGQNTWWSQRKWPFKMGSSSLWEHLVALSCPNCFSDLRLGMWAWTLKQ